MLKYRFSSAFFIALALALLVFGSNNTVIMARIRSEIVNFFVPVLNIASRPTEIVSDFFDWTRQVAIVFSDNERLRAENRRLRRAQIIASQLAIDNQRLKKLLNIGEGRVKIIAAARVVADSDSPFFKSVLINRGTRDGVKKGQAIINEDGIVGRIINTGRSSSRVLLVTDINSRIPVKLGENGINMILEGDNSPFPKLVFAPIGKYPALGDLILTSGFGMVFPHDLPVGQVVKRDKDGIRVKLSAKLYKLNYVGVVEYKITHRLITAGDDNRKQDK